MYKYELFKIKSHESITEMTNHLMALLTTLKKLEKYFSKEEVNNKILRILSKKDYESQVTSIEEAQDLSALSTDVLIRIKQSGEEKKEKKNKKKSIALKALQNDSEEENLEDSSN